MQEIMNVREEMHDERPGRARNSTERYAGDETGSNSTNETTSA